MNFLLVLLISLTLRFRKKPFCITIDGGAATGKSSISRSIAYQLGIPYFESGAYYRVIAYLFLREYEGVDISQLTKYDWASIFNVVRSDLSCKLVLGSNYRVNNHLFLGNADITTLIHNQELDAVVPLVAANPDVRWVVNDIGKNYLIDSAAKKSTAMIADGRDMGTACFPDAELKLFLMTSMEEKAIRRAKQRYNGDWDRYYDQIYQEMVARDKRDAVNTQSASDAYVLDTTHMSESFVRRKVLLGILKKLWS